MIKGCIYPDCFNCPMPDCRRNGLTAECKDIARALEEKRKPNGTYTIKRSDYASEKDWRQAYMAAYNRA